jgi:hypothetical protein
VKLSLASNRDARGGFEESIIIKFPVKSASPEHESIPTIFKGRRVYLSRLPQGGFNFILNKIQMFLRRVRII